MIYFIFVCRYGLLWNFNLNGYLFSVLDDYVWSLYMKYDILFMNKNEKYMKCDLIFFWF